MASGNEGGLSLTNIDGAQESVVYIWTGTTSVGIKCGAGAEICCGAKGLLQIFGQGKMSVWYIWVGINVS